jgi:uncharacterized protein (TIGR00290 family)
MDEHVVAWSGGKDCALALHELREAGREVVELLTTINREYDRSSMHGVRRALYERQASALGLPINLVPLRPEPSNDEYERLMARELERYRNRDVRQVVFADLFLEDVREYRERQLAELDVEGVWPLWGRDTGDLVERFLDLGFEAIVVTADAELFDASMVGCPFDGDFLSALPADVDPCGEHGEFHTFVWNGPVFDRPVPVAVDETVTRPVGDGAFHFADLEPADRP